MQEKEVTPIETETIIDAVEAVIGVSGGELHKLLVAVADRLTEQEKTIRHLRTELCNASAILMTHLETIKTIQAEVDLLNKRPKR